MTHNISIEKVFEFPLLPQPTFLSNFLTMSNKVANLLFSITWPKTLYHLLQIQGTYSCYWWCLCCQKHYQPTITQHCLMFASVLRTMLMKVLKCQVDLCFDVYESPSTKDIKRRDQGSEKIKQNFTFG